MQIHGWEGGAELTGSGPAMCLCGRLEITYIYPWVHIPPYLHGSMAMYKYQVIQTMQQILHEGLQEGLALRLEIHLVWFAMLHAASNLPYVSTHMTSIKISTVQPWMSEALLEGHICVMHDHLACLARFQELERVYLYLCFYSYGIPRLWPVSFCRTPSLRSVTQTEAFCMK